MEEKRLSSELSQAEEATTRYGKSLPEPSNEKHNRRQQALQQFAALGACMLCGAQATHRHSKTGHRYPVTAGDTVPVCDDCHWTIHSADRPKQRGASWAWRNPYTEKKLA